MTKLVLSMNNWRTVRELSALTADAILGGRGRQIIICLLKKLDGNSQQRREYISDDEWLELGCVWAKASLPDLVQGTPLSMWPRYEAAFRRWKTNQKWELEPIFDDQEYIQNDIYVSHAATVRAKEKDLIRAIRKGEIVAWDDNRSPIVDGSDEKLQKAKISPGDFGRYAASIGLTLLAGDADTSMTNAIQIAEKAAPAAISKPAGKKYDEYELRRILDRLSASDMTQAKLAKELGVSPQRVSALVKQAKDQLSVKKNAFERQVSCLRKN
jgi:hypothetical protein